NTNTSYQCILLAYTQAVGPDLSLVQKQKKRRLWRRIVRHSKRRQAGGLASLIPLFPFARRRLRRMLPRRKRKPNLTRGTAALVALFQFWKRRKRKAPAPPWRHHHTPFHGDVTPIAPRGQAGCFTITVSEQLAAIVAVSEYLVAGEIGT